MQMWNIIHLGPEYNICNQGGYLLIRNGYSHGIYNRTGRNSGETQTETVVLQVGEDR